MTDPNNQLRELLAKAATLCVENGGDLDVWMRSAWTAYMDARPGYREYLEEQRLIGELDELRKIGRIATA